MSYRADRGVWSPVLEIAGRRIPSTDMISLTIRGTGEPDRYLHCWTALELPEKEEDLAKLKADLSKMHREFGPDYLSIPHTHLRMYQERIANEAPGKKVKAGLVKYTSRREQWSPFCKSEKFLYQREFRFLAAECDEKDTTPIYSDIVNIRDLAELNAPIELQYEGETILQLSTDGVA